MRLFATALSLLFFVCSILAQGTQILAPAPGSLLVAGSNVNVQVGMGGYPQSVDVVAIVIGLSRCLGGQCDPPSSFMGTILYQGPYTAVPGKYYANYVVTIPQDFFIGNASLNVINLYLVGASNAPTINYVSEKVTVVAAPK